MLTGTVPFEADSTVSVALMHLQEKPVPPNELVPDLPKSLNDIVLKALEKDPESRYKTARAMRSDLVRSLSDPNGTFVNDPNDKGQKTNHRPSIYVLIAMCVFLPIMLVGIFVLIYATSCKSGLPSETEGNETDAVPIIETPYAETTPEPTGIAVSKALIPNLLGYSLDDALHTLYFDCGFTNLIVEFTDQAQEGTVINSVISISASYDGNETHLEQPVPTPEPLSSVSPSPSPAEETPEPTAEPSPLPSADDGSETVVAVTPAVPEEDSISYESNPPTAYAVEDSYVTPSPDYSNMPDHSDVAYATDTPIRLKVYRKTLGSYKADVSFTVSLINDFAVNLVEIGYETANFEDIPFRVILHSGTYQRQVNDITETATVHGYEPVTRMLYLYVNNVVRSTPQTITFTK